MKATHNPPTGVEVTPADLLRLAAVYLQRRGWTQSVDFASTGEAFPPACALGALTMAAYGRCGSITIRTDIDRVALRLLDRSTAHLAGYLWDTGRTPEHDYYGALCCSDREIVSDWNDEHGQDLTAVVDVLTAAADEWDRLHRPGGENR
jgi:hypothetical protein